MAKTRNSRISKESQEIIEILQSGEVSVSKIVKKGYKESTVKYYKRKLFKPGKYKSFLKKAMEKMRLNRSLSTS